MANLSQRKKLYGSSDNERAPFMKVASNEEETKKTKKTKKLGRPRLVSKQKRIERGIKSMHRPMSRRRDSNLMSLTVIRFKSP